MDPQPSTRPKRKRWRFWTVVVLNVAGLALIVPLLKVTVPLVGVWWYTRSQERLREHYQHSSEVRRDAQPPPRSEGAPTEAATQLGALTNQLAAIDSLSNTDLQKIVAQHFGTPPRPTTNVASEFDLASAIFDSISRTTLVYRGQTYYGYQVNLVDENGRHRTNIDCFAEPNLEYERSMATLDLVNSSPQLKKVYQAMASTLAQKASASTNSPDESSTDGPVLRLDPESLPK